LVDQLQYELETRSLKRLVILFFSFVLFLSCENNQENINHFISLEELPVEELFHTEIQYTENGIIKVRVFSNNMQRFVNDEDKVELYGGVHFDFFKLDNKNKKSVLTSEKAIINNTTNIMMALNDVVLKSSDNKTLQTEQLIWDKNLDLIYTDLEVKIQTNDEIITGVGFKSTPDFMDYEISKAKGSFSIDK